MEKMILTVKHLSVSFTQYGRGLRRREIQVIKDLSLSVSVGEIVAVVGSSGSGKSLLAHAVMGILPTTAACPARWSLTGGCWTRRRRRGFGERNYFWCRRVSPT